LEFCGKERSIPGDNFAKEFSKPTLTFTATLATLINSQATRAKPLSLPHTTQEPLLNSHTCT